MARNNIRFLHTRSVYHLQADIMPSGISSVSEGNGYHCKKPDLSDRSGFLHGGVGGIYPPGINFESLPICCQKQKDPHFVRIFFFWRSGWDSNPRAGVTDKLISSQPRYDHFDTTPYKIGSVRNILILS